MLKILTEVLALQRSQREIEDRFRLTSGDFHILMVVRYVSETSYLFCKVEEVAALRGGLNRTAIYASLKKLTDMNLIEKVIKGKRFKKGAISRYYPTQTGWTLIRDSDRKREDHYLTFSQAINKGDYETLAKIHRVKIESMFGTPKPRHYIW